MDSSKGSSQSVRNLMYPAKHAHTHALLPPKIPFPSVSVPYTEYIPIGSRQKIRDEKPNQPQHQRTSSESNLVEELPFWLDDLLNEPPETQTPSARKLGHRRSSSDSYAYLDTGANLQNDFGYRNNAVAGRNQREVHDVGFYSNNRQVGGRPWLLPFSRDNSVGVGGVSSYMSQEVVKENLSHEPKKMLSSEEINNNANHNKGVAYEADNTKRARQQFAQRSRVRKLQYISELERNVQALQAEGSKVSAELDFLNQRNLILSLENKALKQRLESIAQEKLIKQLEQEVLEKEIGRLRAMYQQQQQTQHKPTASHGRSNSKDLESQFSNLSLKAKDSNCRRDSVSMMGQFHF